MPEEIIKYLYIFARNSRTFFYTSMMQYIFWAIAKQRVYCTDYPRPRGYNPLEKRACETEQLFQRLSLLPPVENHCLINDAFCWLCFDMRREGGSEGTLWFFLSFIYNGRRLYKSMVNQINRFYELEFLDGMNESLR